MTESTRGTGLFPSINRAVIALVDAAKEKGKAPGVPVLGQTQMRALVLALPTRVVLATIKPDKPTRDAIASVQASAQANLAAMDALRRQIAVMDALSKQIAAFGSRAD